MGMPPTTPLGAQIDFTSLVTTGQQTNMVLTAMLSTLETVSATQKAVLTLLTAGLPVLPLPGAASQSQPANPSAPASTTTYTMQGLAGSVTPVLTGAVLVIISGVVLASTVTAGDGIEWQISVGSGTAPTNGAALTGTQYGQPQPSKNPATVIAADVAVPFSTQAVVAGLTKTTPYWIDLAAKSLGTASSGSLANVSISAIEL
jgi:hypothetical protein